MSATKNKLVRYKIIDKCLREARDSFETEYEKRYSLEDFVKICSEELFKINAIENYLCLKTIQNDIRDLREVYNAPIKVYGRKFYRYDENAEDPNYSITSLPISEEDLDALKRTVEMLGALGDFGHFEEMSDLLGRLKDKLNTTSEGKKPIINYDSAPLLRGLKWLNPLYDYTSAKKTIKILYHPFHSDVPIEYILHPHLLKEYNNRWYIFASKNEDMALRNFALDRILDVQPSDVPYKENETFDAEHYFDNMIGVTKHSSWVAEKITFWVEKGEVNYIRTKPLHSSQCLVSTNEEDGSAIFEMEVVVNYELYSVLRGLGSSIKVLSPAHVVEEIKQEFQKALELYK